VLRHAAPQLPHWQAELGPQPIFAPAPPIAATEARTQRLSPGRARRLQGRYGAQAAALAAAAQDGELEEIPGTETLWAQLRWAARHESVQHLEDLMLRRSRLGIQLAQGAAAVLGRVRAICQPELGWDDQRWAAEEAAYLALCRSNYSLPKARA